MRKNIIFTFDYELFLGKRSGSVKKCLLSPTDKIRSLLNKYNLKAIFFVDTTYLFRLQNEAIKNENCKKNLELIFEQLHQLKHEGHYIYHHLHPHWLDAIYLPEIDQWDLSNISKYAFSQIGPKERDAIMEFSFSVINEFEDNKPSGFRAGGLYIQPFEDFRPLFEKYKIHYEFSVVPDDFSFSKEFSYDFRNFPTEPFQFNENIGKKDESGIFQEFPISMLKLNGLSKIMNGLYYRFMENKTNNFDGIPSSLPIIKRTRNTSFSMQLPLSIEFLNPINKYSILNFMEKNNYVHFLSHPKLISDKNLKSLEYILNKISKNHTIVSDFKEITVHSNLH
jgi:hypothetical protein